MTPKVEMRQGTVALDQLKYENDRLKHALAQRLGRRKSGMLHSLS